MKGTVRSFVSEKRFGFIDGNDGQSYFVHINDVSGSNFLVKGQAVEFEPTPTPKGLSAKKVKAGQIPEVIYVNPSEFIMTKSDHVKGCETIKVLTKTWGESNDPNEARNQLKLAAINQGANAVVCMHLEKYTGSDSCSNYKYTMHRFHGYPVIVKKTKYSADPALISESRSEISRISSLKVIDACVSTHMVRPPAYVFYPVVVYFWLRTISKILGIMALYVAGKIFGIKRNN